jgi:multidrug efflux pump subunit AcrA (membrane-fusion protein)
VSKLYVTKNDRAELRIVQLGRELGEFVEVVRGLSAGERVVAKGALELADGALISESR